MGIALIFQQKSQHMIYFITSLFFLLLSKIRIDKIAQTTVLLISERIPSIIDFEQSLGRNRINENCFFLWSIDFIG